LGAVRRASPPLAAALSIAWLVSAGSLRAAPAPGAEEVTILRDQWGIPHIFAASEEGGCFGMGYAQAEDRLEEIFRQYRRAAGTMAEVFGKDHLFHDYRQRVWRHRRISEERYPSLSARSRAMIEAFQEGIRRYASAHPEEVPAWAEELHPWQVVALGRYAIWGWPEGDAGADLSRAGIEPDPVEPRGSNQWLVAPERTAAGAPIALIDPHLGWYGEFRFYEARLYGGSLEVSGVCILGTPIPSLGHNRFLSVAMTTGGPDCADVYQEVLSPEHPGEYRYQGQWRKMTVALEKIGVREGNSLRTVERQIEYTHHGPLVAHRGEAGYAMKLPYFEEVGLLDQVYAMMTARNLKEMQAALEQFQLMEQNIMVGTVDGDIYYVRYGRVPVRAEGAVWDRPIPGDVEATEWLGIHPLKDLVQVLNPPQGYMQNCNVAPAVMMKGSPLTAERYRGRSYLYNVDQPYLHQRAAQTVEELEAAKRMTLEEAIAIAGSTAVFNAGLWQERLKKAAEGAAGRLAAEPGPARLLDLILSWNRRSDPDSTGANGYRYWKEEVYRLKDEVEPARRLKGERLLGKVALLADRAGIEPPPIPGPALVEALSAAAAKLQSDWGRLAVPFGESFRAGREPQGSGKPARSFPVGGGSLEGMSTPRALSFKRGPDGKSFLARGGQTSTQVVVLSRPPRSFSVLPLGESDHPDSPHYDDQAEKLLSAGRLKPTYFLDREELEKHVERRTVLEFKRP
jgi:acyl-homoserine-lactone acylase